jgi:hypothetical protein
MGHASLIAEACAPARQPASIPNVSRRWSPEAVRIAAFSS